MHAHSSWLHILTNHYTKCYLGRKSFSYAPYFIVKVGQLNNNKIGRKAIKSSTPAENRTQITALGERCSIH